LSYTRRGMEPRRAGRERTVTGGDEKTTKQGLAPVVDQNSRILILGTLPGDESLRQQQYYSDPGNHFWRLLSGVFGAPTGESYDERLEFLAYQRVALWDVLQGAVRPGSSDAAITEPRPNDFGELFSKFPDLRRVAFNGTKADALWRTYNRRRMDVPHESLITEVLPSSSGTPGRHVRPFQEKLVRWRVFLRA
jgi:TDG/mug DNA glycosylase family protein